MVRSGLGVARQHQVPPVGGRQVDIHHLQRRELLQHGAGRQSRRARSGEVLQGDVRAVGDEGDEDVRLDPFLALLEDRPEGEVVLGFLERLLDLGEPRVVPPQRGGVLAGQVGAQQIPALAASRPTQPVAPQREAEGLRGHGLVRRGQADLHQVVGAARLLLRGAELGSSSSRVNDCPRNSCRRCQSFFRSQGIRPSANLRRCGSEGQSVPAPWTFGGRDGARCSVARASASCQPEIVVGVERSQG